VGRTTPTAIKTVLDGELSSLVAADDHDLMMIVIMIMMTMLMITMD